ncbi:MAG: aconitase X swivel domain-containing protein [Actinomycetota bacterium]
MSEGRALVTGEARGPALVLDEPLSFWGGVDPETGRVIDVHHPQLGVNVTGRVLVMPSGRGSSSSSSVLVESSHAGTGPVAIVMREPDPIIALGAIVIRELFGTRFPVVVVDEAAYRSLRNDAIVIVRADDAGAVVKPQ